jgi:hypothetical protein
MRPFKKILKILSVLLLGLVLLYYGLTAPTWPSKTRLCRDIQDFLPKDECIHMENAQEIIKRAFPEGEVTSSDVKGALEEYLYAEYPTTYGHREVYHLSVKPVDYLFDYFDAYDFGYDNNGILISFSYDDF